MKLTSNLKLYFSIIMVFIILNSFTSKVNTNLRSHFYAPNSYTTKELEYIKDFDDFGDKVEHIQNSNYFDILKFGSGIKNRNSNMNKNLSSTYRFVQKNNKVKNSYSNRQENEGIPMANLKHPEQANNKYNGVFY